MYGSPLLYINGLQYKNAPCFTAYRTYIYTSNISIPNIYPKITFEVARQNFSQGATASIINQFAKITNDKALNIASVYHILTHYSPLTSFIYFNK